MDKDFKIERLKKKKELFTFIFLFLRISFVKCFILETKCPNWCLCPLNNEKKKRHYPMKICLLLLPLLVEEIAA